MRAVVFTLALVACGAHVVPPVTSAAPTARATTTATRDCAVSWVRIYHSLADLASDAEVIVRATALAQDTVQLRAFGAGNVVTLRDARRTTFRVSSTVRTNGPPATEVRVVEDVCQNLEVVPGEEWLLFIYRFDPTYGPVGQDPPHYFARGGPQGQFRFRGGVVSGPFYTFADVVHSYEGATIADVLRDIP